MLEKIIFAFGLAFGILALGLVLAYVIWRLSERDWQNFR
jgi:flagellar biogenesis protein FliO